MTDDARLLTVNINVLGVGQREEPEVQDITDGRIVGHAA